MVTNTVNCFTIELVPVVITSFKSSCHVVFELVYFVFQGHQEWLNDFQNVLRLLRPILHSADQVSKACEYIGIANLVCPLSYLIWNQYFVDQFSCKRDH
jgi:hypothetical protein